MDQLALLRQPASSPAQPPHRPPTLSAPRCPASCFQRCGRCLQHHLALVFSATREMWISEWEKAPRQSLQLL